MPGSRAWVRPPRRRRLPLFVPGDGGNVMRRMNGEAGFSLIEVTMAALLTVGIIGAVFGLLNRNQQIFVTESGVTDMNQNMRTAVDLLTRDAQSAGMGLPSRNPGSFAAIFFTDGANGAPDKIMIANGD